MNKKPLPLKSKHLTGSALDWAVAILEFPKGAFGGEAEHYSGNRNERWMRIPDKQNRTYVRAQYSTDWAQGGLIIEREGIDVLTVRVEGCGWRAYHTPTHEAKTHTVTEGPTPLIAAMRCYVASKLGDELEVPDELQ